MSAVTPTTTPESSARPAPDTRLVRADRCLVMGTVNVTEDSFSDGGRYLDVGDAVGHGVHLAGEGADLVDVGGESTRPGAVRVPAEAEASRVVPVVRGLVEAGVTVSVDTMRASVAERALDAGAHLINDVSGGLADPEMARVVAEAGAPWILMHWVSPDAFASGAGGAAHAESDVVADVAEHLSRRADAAIAAGVAPENIVVDPGLGFAKTGEDNWLLLRHLDRLTALGFPVLVAASRKRFLGTLLDDGAGAPAPGGRDAATAAISALAAERGAWGVRVHDVRPSVDAVRVARAWRGEGAPAAAAEGERRG